VTIIDYCMGGGWTSKSCKSGTQTRQTRTRFSRAEQAVIKTILEPSWVDLGRFWRLLGATNLIFCLFCLSFVNNRVWGVINILNVLWAEFGPTWIPKGSAWSEMGAKICQQLTKHRSPKQLNFDRIQGRHA